MFLPDCESLHKHQTTSSTLADPFVTINPFDSPDFSAVDGTVRPLRSPSVTHLINHFEQLQTSPSAAPLPPPNAALSYITPLPHNTTTLSNGAYNGSYHGSRTNSNHKIDVSVPSWFGAKEATLVNLDTLTNERGVKRRHPNILTPTIIYIPKSYTHPNFTQP